MAQVVHAGPSAIANTTNVFAHATQQCVEKSLDMLPNKKNNIVLVHKTSKLF